MSEKKYINTAIAYVNGKPHIGFAMEVIQEDVLARYYRLKGYDVWSVTGTDEYGSKLFQKAKELGVEPQELADKNAVLFKDLKKHLNLSFDDFIRTSSKLHNRGAQKLWNLINENGDLYKNTYSGLYCVGCEAYVTEKDLVDGKCPNHMKEPVKLEEENYFFRLSKYGDELKKRIESDELRIVPEERKNEILSFINAGLQDISFSRPKEMLSWGVEVPNDPDQVMYVWCDALSNYLTCLGYDEDSDQYKKYWPTDINIVGKDILRFHAAIWPAMLMSAGLPVQKAIYVHGFITSEGKKMSKSLGNVVDPVEYVAEHGTDPLRYYLMREIPTTSDGDFSKERFKVLYNSELVNTIGNFVNRVVTMIGKYHDKKVPDANWHQEVQAEVDRTVNDYQAAIELFNLKEALTQVVNLIAYGNRYIEEEKPWALAKEDTEKLATVMKSLAEIMVYTGILLEPFIPEASEKIQSMIGTFNKKDVFEKEELLHPGTSIEKGDLLFSRIED